jgi:hypothetical protein
VETRLSFAMQVVELCILFFIRDHIVEYLHKNQGLDIVQNNESKTAENR